MKEQTFTLPYPPSVNTYWRWMKGRPIVSSKGRKYRKEVEDRIAEQKISTFSNARIAVFIRLEMPDRRRRDLDNTQKAMLDAIGHAGVYDDDAQIDVLYVERGKLAPPGMSIVTIRELGETA